MVWEYAWKIGAAALGAAATRGVVKNAQANHVGLMLSLAEHAWGATEVWKAKQIPPATPDESEAHFFVEMGSVMYTKHLSMTMADSVILRGWVKVRSASAKRKK